MVKTSVADPDPGSGAFLIPGSGMNIFLSLVKNFGLKIFKFFVADPVSGSGAFLTWDPGWKSSDPR